MRISMCNGRGTGMCREMGVGTYSDIHTAMCNGVCDNAGAGRCIGKDTCGGGSSVRAYASA